MRHRTLGLAVLLLMTAATSHAQTLSAPFASDYTLTNVGSVSGLPGPYGGLVFQAGNTNSLLIGGNANNGSGSIYSVNVVRGSGNHITGFSGSATLFSTAPNIDGGLAYGPGGVLFYTAFPNNQIGEIKPGSSSPDKIVSLSGVTSSVGSLNFVPAGFGGAGGFKILSYSGGGQYSATLSSDGTGTYDITGATLQSQPNRGPEGIAFVAGGNADFAGDSALLSEYGSGTVGAYDVTATGDLNVASRRDFITGLGGAEGAVIDPLTGDFVFSTFGGGNRVLVVQGFIAPAAPPVPEPSSVAFLSGLFVTGAAFLRRRKNKK